MWTYEHTDELYHYGVVGMKWGVRKANRKISRNERLEKKAVKYDKKAAAMTKKSEQAHAKKDLKRSNRKAVKAAKYEKKAAAIDKKVLKTEDEYKKVMLERRSATYKYKASVNKAKGNRISKTVGYGAEAMKYSIKSDRATRLAAKARMKIAKNDAYVAKMNRKISNLSEEELKNGYAFVNELRKRK